jgi:hypothetical protein
MSKWRSVGTIILASVCGAAYTGERPRAQEPVHATEQASPAAVPISQLCRIDIKGEKKDQWMRLPKPESSVTVHRFGVGSKSFDYTATAGTLIIRDDEDKPIASIGYVAYVRHDLKGGGARPLMFAFNGGPGSSSLWLHMGVRRDDILRMFLRKGVALAGVGIVDGLVFSASTASLMASLLYGVRPHDPAVFLIVPLLLFVVAVLASYFPARRATRVNSMIALREA